MAVQAPRRLFTVDEYDRMAEAEIVSPDERVELIDGEILAMTPSGPHHRACVAILDKEFQRQLGRRAFVWTQMSLRLGTLSEPEPDIVVVHPRDDHYRRSDPSPKDIALIIEVADTSLRRDRELKASLYARSGVREFWIVDVAGEAIEVYRAPRGGTYRRRQRVERGAVVRPRAFPDVVVAVSDLFD